MPDEPAVVVRLGAVTLDPVEVAHRVQGQQVLHSMWITCG